MVLHLDERVVQTMDCHVQWGPKYHVQLPPQLLHLSSQLSDGEAGHVDLSEAGPDANDVHRVHEGSLRQFVRSQKRRLGQEVHCCLTRSWEDIIT